MQIFKKAHLSMACNYVQDVKTLRSFLNGFKADGGDAEYDETESCFNLIYGVQDDSVLTFLVENDFLTQDEADKLIADNVQELTFYC